MGQSSLLVHELGKHKQFHRIESNFSLQLESVGAWLKPQHLEILKDLIFDLLDTLQVEPVTREELAKAQHLLSHDYIFSTKTPNQLAGLVRPLLYYRLSRIVFVPSLYH
ncbi:insulinase family protein [cyanobacterium endosymbiont of Rhopalodia gibberula]|uniref:insulinase family protein n=1 Tax=cyanobacterium endosymbiont of Rhopalodia gibberula TaxID=1763363 RepID=UPI001E41CEFB|nr:insulinase family protein [cyanobacterium endosymbiont of Rhopalodia gibberula]